MVPANRLKDKTTLKILILISAPQRRQNSPLLFLHRSVRQTTEIGQADLGG
jgi:hypothetical protein